MDLAGVTVNATSASMNSDLNIIDTDSNNDSDDLVYWDTFIASIKSVGTACTLAAVGLYMHQRGLISTPGKKMLALISQQVTFPLFLFTKIISCPHNGHECPNVYESLQQVWYLALWPLFVVGVGLLVGRMVAAVTNTPVSQWRSVMAAVGFGNSTGLPITLLTVVHSNFSKQTELGRVDPTLFLSVYLLLYPVLQWGLGGWLLAPTPNELEQQDEQKRNLQSNNKAETKTTNGTAIMSGISSVPLNDTAVPMTATTTTPLYSLNNNLNNNTHAASSSLYTNVLNNTSVDNYYRRHRQGLYSSDEGLYLSDFNLQALARNNHSFYSNGGGSQTGATAGAVVTTAALEDPPRYVTRTNSLGSLAEHEHSNDAGSNNAISNNSDEDDSQPEFLLYDTAPAAAGDSHATQPSTPTDSIESPPAPPMTTTDEALDAMKPLPQQQQEHETEQQPLLLSSIKESKAVSPTNTNSNSNTTTNGFYGATATSTKTKTVKKPMSENTPMTPLRKTMSFLSLSFVENKYMDNFGATLHNIGQRCFQPPVMGAIFGILVAISPLRQVFVDLTATGTDIAPMEWLFDGLYSVGLTAVPINMIILGCNLSNSYNKFQASRRLPTTATNNTPTSSSADTLTMRTMLGIVVGKMIIMPAIGFVSAWTLQNYVLHIPDAIDAAFYLVLLIVFLTPTANNVMVMVELSGSNTKEGIANVIALQYAVAPVILSATMTVAIGYAQRL